MIDVSDIKIENNIPPPDLTTSESSGLVKIISELEVGGSFAVPRDERKTLQHAVWWARKKPNNRYKVFLTRSVEENDVKVTRCWRMEDVKPIVVRL